MQKILSLGGKEFMTGIAPSSQVQDKGLWHRAEGITVFRDPFLGSDNLGVLQASPLSTEITNGVIADVPIAWEADVINDSTKKLYIWGNSGQLYVIDISGDNMPTKLTSSALGTAANGLFIMKHSSGVKKLWYFRQADLGYYGNLLGTPTFNSAEYTSGIQSTPWHPTHRVFDRVYFGNGSNVGSAEDNGSGGLTVDPAALDLTAEERVNCLSDDGTYLVIGATQNTSTDPLVHGKTRILFWDMEQSSWQREWPIDDASILAIRRNGSYMEAVTTRGIFAFTFASPPVPLLPLLGSGDTPDVQYPTQFAVDLLGGAVAFGGTGKVSTFGKVAPQLSTALFEPFAGFDGSVTMLAATAKTNDLYAGTSNSKLYRVKLDGAGQTGVSGETVYIDLGRWWQIGRVVLGFDGQLATSDDLSIELEADDGTSSSAWGSATYTDNGAIRVKEMYGSLEARKLKLIINFNGGTPRVRTIEVWGDPLANPTHTRV
jgi:hypothetical protein